MSGESTDSATVISGATLESAPASTLRDGIWTHPSSTEALNEVLTGLRPLTKLEGVFFPKGLAGRLYWWAIVPFHGIVFAGMLNHIVAIAERAGRRADARG